MVLIAQSDSNEDSQSRQLRVSKKLSKAISSVPRSRFQKPRPNLPGSKRADSSIPVTARKTNGSSQNSIDINTVEISQNDKSVKDSVNLNTDETSQNNDTPKNSENLNNTNEISRIDDTFVTNSEILITNETSETHSIVKSCEILIIDETSQKAETVKNPDTLHIDETSLDDKNSENINTCEISQNDVFKDSENSNTNETSQSDILKKVENLNRDETSQNADTIFKSCEILNAESQPDASVEERIDTPLNTLPNSTDKSSKYPHLTSILSKKRAEPKKEVQHKKRKKFKKGEAAPERSKMTMADFIYWNPTTTDQSQKNVATQDEIPLNTNIDEPEGIVNAEPHIEENNICDSVPKLVISEDGSINIDQSSLIVSRNVPEPIVTHVISKDETTYSSFRNRPMTKHWTDKDTTIFYKALSLVGTDFGLMEKIFPHRSRRELKLKFKREEKFNIDLINRAMYESHLTFDANTLGDLIKTLNDLSDDVNSETAQNDLQSSAKVRKKTVNRKRKATKITKSAVPELSDSVTESLPSEAINEIKKSTKRMRKAKKLPEDFVDADEIDEIVLLEEISEEPNNNDAVCELNSAENNVENTKSKKSVQSPSKTCIQKTESDKMCETTNVEILCIDDLCEESNVELNSGCGANKAIIVPENTFNLSQVISQAIQNNSSENVPQTISFTSGNEQEQCITLEYVEGVDSAADLTMYNNVMAYEVVTSLTPVAKRKRKINNTMNVFRKDKFQESCHPFQLSSTNYTPV